MGELRETLERVFGDQFSLELVIEEVPEMNGMGIWSTDVDESVGLSGMIPKMIRKGFPCQIFGGFPCQIFGGFPCGGSCSCDATLEVHHGGCR